MRFLHLSGFFSILKSHLSRKSYLPENARETKKTEKKERKNLARGIRTANASALHEGRQGEKEREREGDRQKKRRRKNTMARQSLVKLMERVARSQRQKQQVSFFPYFIWHRR